MRQRPFACLALAVFLLLTLLPTGLFYEPLRVTGKCEAKVAGRVARRTLKADQVQLLLQGCQIQSESGSFETEKLIVYLDAPADYPVGANLSLSGTLYPNEEPTNPGQFNSRLYYQGQGIAYRVYAKSVQMTGLSPAPIKERLLGLKERLCGVYGEALDEKDGSLLRAMVLGEKQGLYEETKELYQRNGISHLLAISGLHLSLLGMGLYRLLRRISGSCFVSGVPALLFLCAYCWMTGGSLSAVRATAMCCLAILADWMGRTYDMVNAAGAVALVLMLTNPLCAKQSAYRLSFGAVVGIGTISPLWSLYKKKMRKAAQSLSVGLSVLFVTFPVLLGAFFTYPLYSTFLNLLVVPLMSVLMAFGILCGFLGLWSLRAAHLFGIPCHWILSFYERAGSFCQSLPGASLTVGSPAPWKTALYYAALSAALLLLYREKRRKKYWLQRTPFRPRKSVLAFSLCMVLACGALLCLRVCTGLEVTMLDVGQGDSIYIQSPTGTTLLMDGGSTNVKKVGAYRILPFLKSQGVGMLDYLMVSHMDQDHISGLVELVEECRKGSGVQIGHAVLPDLLERDEAYQELEALLKEAEIPILYLGAGDRLTEEGFSLSCLWPDKGARSDDRNDLSLVLLAQIGDFEMLLTGDIGEETEEKLARSGRLPSVEVLKTAHHGSRHSSTEAFLSQARPVLSLVSCSAVNRYGHPGKEALERLRSVGSQIWCTKDLGAITVWTDGHAVRARSFLEP